MLRWIPHHLTNFYKSHDMIGAHNRATSQNIGNHQPRIVEPSPSSHQFCTHHEKKKNLQRQLSQHASSPLLLRFHLRAVIGDRTGGKRVTDLSNNGIVQSCHVSHLQSTTGRAALVPDSGCFKATRKTIDTHTRPGLITKVESEDFLLSRG